MEEVNLGWYLQRCGYPDTIYHLNTLLQNKKSLNSHLIIGRKPGEDVDIVCNGKTVSRKHCALVFKEDHWEIEDMGSMNGVFLNRMKIDTRKLTPLDLGHVLGIGAMDTSNPDFFVFEIWKTVIKEEKDSGSVYVSDSLVGTSTDKRNFKDAQVTTPLPEEHLTCVDNSKWITTSELPDCVRRSSLYESSIQSPDSKNFSNRILPFESDKKQPSQPKYVAFGGNIKVSGELMQDVKIRPETKCAVALKRLPSSMCLRKQGKRPRRLESDSDDDISPIKKVKLSINSSSPNFVGSLSTDKRCLEMHTSSRQQGHALHAQVSSCERAVGSIMTEKESNRKNELSMVSDPIYVDISVDKPGISKDNASPAAPPKAHFVIEKFSTGQVVERRDTSVTTKDSNHNLTQSGYTEELVTEGDICDSITIHSSSSRLTAPEVVTNANQYWDEDIIVLDSDEETFTSQRIKAETIDVVEAGECSPLHDHTGENEDADLLKSSTVVNISSEEDSNFFTEVPQQNENILLKKKTNTKPDRELPAVNRTNKTNEALPTFKFDCLNKPKALIHPRKVQEIPMQLMKSRRSSKKSVCSSKARKSKAHDSVIQQQRKERLKQVSAKPPTEHTDRNMEHARPSKSSGETGNSSDTSHSSVKPLKAPVKAKNTKKTRNEKYVEDVVNQGLPLDSQKRGLPTTFEFKIPKRPRTDVENSAIHNSAIDSGFDETPNLNCDQKHDPLNELDVTEALASLPSPQFKKPIKRIAHAFIENGQKTTFHENVSSNSNVIPDPLSKHSHPPSRSRDPRKDARSLGNHSGGRRNNDLATAILDLNLKSSLERNGGILPGVASLGNSFCEVPIPGVSDVFSETPTSLTSSRIDQDDRPFRNASPDKRKPRNRIERDDTSFRNASPISDNEMCSTESYPRNQGRSLSSRVVLESTSISSDSVASNGDGSIVIEQVSSTSNPSDPRLHLNRGILNLSGSRSKTSDQKRVFWANEDKVHEIEPRPNRSQRKVKTSVPELQVHSARLNPSPPPGSRVDTKAIIDEMLLRIVCWNYNWIAEQRKQAKEVPPPLLQEQVVNGRLLPQLNALPVVSSFVNMEAYLGVFYPLMFHELWATVCKESETIQSRTLKVVCSKENQQDGPWTFFQCQCLLVEGSFRLWDQDLMVLALPVTDQKDVKVFGIAEKVELRQMVRTANLDQDLLSTCTSKADFLLSFILRVKRAQRYDSMNNPRILTIAKVTTLKTAVKQFCVNADLTMSPLCNVILRPTDHKIAFELINSITSEGNQKLNARQLAAVRSISDTILKTNRGEPKVALLQGPPGTGKSHVIIQLVFRMLYKYFEKNSKKFPRILICAPSNYVVDEIAHRLMLLCNAQKEKFNLLRVGVPAAIHAKVQKITLEHLSERQHRINVSKRQSPYSNGILTLKEEVAMLAVKKQSYTSAIKSANAEGNMDEAKRIARKLEDLESQMEKIDQSLKESKNRHVRHFDKYRHESKAQVISGAHVICSTLNSCRNKDMERVFLNEWSSKKTENDFLCCIVDEASQCTEPESLSPLALGISKLVLIGDPEQLPATVMSQFAQSLRFDQSLFNRFFSYHNGSDSSSSVQMLDMQYRMAPSICKWPSKFFYGRKLLTAPGLERNGPLADYVVLDLIDSLEEQDVDDGKSVYNVNEARLIALVIKTIIYSPAVRTKSIGVITYYQKQKQIITDKIQDECGKRASFVEVNTVDSFQGQEKDVVILSTVRARAQGRGNDIGFVSSLQRMNVALTRARESLIVCTHFTTLQANEAWKDLIDDAKDRKVAHSLKIENASTIFLCPFLIRSPEQK